MSLKMAYRPEIDGLRAIAVLAVLFYHGGIKIFSGGYVGVDVFFVISGYLITGIIVKEIQGEDFSLVKFYERRIRRIYPAIFTVIAFTMLVSAFLYDAAAYSDISQSAVSITVFLSNMLFWWESGYFEGPSTLKPLLHTWSLSVEEQFYIIFPILMVLIARFIKSRFKLLLILMWLASFATSIYSVYHFESAGFYFMPQRAWELLTGSLLALFAAPARIHAGLRNLFSLAGVGMILASAVYFNDDTLFPGFAAILPVCGSALVIYSGQEGKTLMGNILGLQPIVFIGRISYSLYLWHWPLLVIGKYYLIRDITAMDIGIWLAATLIISILSWKFIENPFRERTFLRTPQIFALAGNVMLLSLITSVTIYANRGFPQRFAADTIRSSANDDFESSQWGRCLTEKKKEPPQDVSFCTIGHTNGEPGFLIWGDSHVRALAPAVNESAKNMGPTGYISYMPGCAPLLGIDRQDRFLGTCNAYNDMILDFIKTHPELKTIILAARWAVYADGTRYNEKGSTIKLVDMWINQESTNAALFDIGLNRTVAKLLELNRNVVIITGAPEVRYDVPSSYVIAARTGRDLNKIIAPTFQEYLDRNINVLTSISAIEDHNNIQVVYLSKALCDERSCYVVMNEQPLYRDDDHLSIYGAHYVSYILDPIFERIESTK